MGGYHMVICQWVSKRSHFSGVTLWMGRRDAGQIMLERNQGVNSIGYFALLKLGDLTQNCPSPSFVSLSPSRLLLGPNFG